VRGSRALIALLVTALVAGCGSSGDRREPGLTSGQVQGLVAQLHGARATAAARDVEGTKAAIARFRRSVARLRRDGALSDATARSLRIGAARVLARVESDNAAPAPVATPTPAAPAPPADHAKKDHKGKHEGRGKHKHDGEGD
jgi:hypothetical protein